MRNVLVTASLIAVGILATACPALANTYKVNSHRDAPDAVTDGICATADSKCTLRAALDETNAGPGYETIKFTTSPFDGAAPGATIKTATPLTVTQRVNIKGGNCGGANRPKPCVRLDGKAAGHDLLAVDAAVVNVDGIAFTHGVSAIVATKNFLTVTNSWFGLELDGGSAPNTNGVLLEGPAPGSTGVVIGGRDPGDRNLFAGNEVGVKIAGSDDNALLGNWFGVNRQGEAASANRTNVQIAAGTSPASYNAVGTAVSPEAEATRACDGSCNVVSGARANGIDLSGAGGTGPADHTVVAGNAIGLLPDGKTALGNRGTGIYVGNASETLVGGDHAAGGNVVAASGLLGVDAGAGSDGLQVQTNLFGSDATGSKPRPNQGGDVRVGADNAFVYNNRAIGKGTIPAHSLDVSGDGASIQANTFGIGADQSSHGFAVSAIRLSGSDNTVSGSANLIAPGAGATGVLIEGGDRNQIENAVFGQTASGAPIPQRFGIRIIAAGANPATGNVVGPATYGVRNQIFNSTENAIEIAGQGNDRNEVSENTGDGGSSGAQGFLDLTPVDGIGINAAAPNAATPAPSLSVAHCDQIQGTGAIAGAKLRLYKTSASGARIDHLVVTLTDDGGGFSGSFASEGSTGAYVMNQTTATGNSSEMSAPLAIAPGGGCP